MGILVGRNTRVLVQGITGRQGSFHTAQMLEYGTQIVAGVTPKKGGQTVCGVPVFNSVKEAVRKKEPDASIIFVGYPFAKAAMFEAIKSGIKLIVCITEGIPIPDAISTYQFAEEKGVRIIGPNCPGIIALGETKIGIMPGDIFKLGEVGIISRSGTLTYEVVKLLTERNFGQSTCIGIGGDPIIGSTFLDLLPLFETDRQTKAVVLIGEVGGADEQLAAESVKGKKRKPIVAFIAGSRGVPAGKRMGHAGAIIEGASGSPEDKIRAFIAAGIPVANSISEIADLVAKVLRGRPKVTPTSPWLRP